MQDAEEIDSQAAPENAAPAEAAREAAAPEESAPKEAANGAVDDVPTPADVPAAAADAPREGLGPGRQESAIEELIGADRLIDDSSAVVAWVRDNLMTLDNALQLTIIVAALVPAALFGPQLRKFISTQLGPRVPVGVARRLVAAFGYVATPIALFAVLRGAEAILDEIGRPHALVSAAGSLLSAWIAIRLVTLVIRSPFWSRVAFYVAWPIAALDAFGVLDDVVARLDAASIPLGENDAGEPLSFSLLDVVRTLIIFSLLFWLAGFAKRFVKDRISTVDEITPSLQALIGKILDVVTPVIAFLVALQIVGFNLATLTIFGGAIGLGVGLGLQRTISNFFAGFTLIADKSIKPGDVIEVGDTFGWVTHMGARYVKVRTRDGTAHLVPYDECFENGVVNWSHADRVVRLHAPFGVAYGTKDLRGVKAMAERAATQIDRVVSDPKPVCNLVGFGDSSVDFDLRFWIVDPKNGVANVTSEVMLALWDGLAEMGVEIPFPQRDLHIKSAPSEVLDLAAANGHATAAASSSG
ncbi:MAG: mechanosensitive ion channel family protein [Parvularculaceae bacterium]